MFYRGTGHFATHQSAEAWGRSIEGRLPAPALQPMKSQA